jgi:hypothetical protein
MALGTVVRTLMALTERADRNPPTVPRSVDDCAVMAFVSAWGVTTVAGLRGPAPSSRLPPVVPDPGGGPFLRSTCPDVGQRTPRRSSRSRDLTTRRSPAALNRVPRGPRHRAGGRSMPTSRGIEPWAALNAAITSSEAHTSTTQNPSADSPATWASSPSNGRFGGDCRRGLPLSAAEPLPRTASRAWLGVPSRPW